MARNGESCLPPREVYATPATVLHLLSLNSRNFARGSCTMPTITYAPPLPSLEYACITLSFPSNLLAVYLCKGTHSPCVYTFSSRRNTARSYICRLPDFSSHLPFSLSSFSFFLSFFFSSPRTKKNIPLFRFVLVLSSADVSRYYPRVAFPFSSIREDHANGLIYSLDTEEEEGKKGWEKVFKASPFFSPF